MRALIATVFLAVLFSTAAAAQAPATSSQPVAVPPLLERVLKYVPDDANLVVVVPSIDGLAAGLSAFGKATGLPDVGDLTARQLLEKVFDQNAEGLDPTGALVLALSAGHDEPLLLASLRSDESWKAATQPSVLQGDVLLYEFGADRFLAASAPGVAIFAREKAELRRALDSTGKLASRLSTDLLPLLGSRQVVVYVDVPAWTAEIDTHLGLVARGMSMGMAAAGPEREASMQIWNWLLERLKRTVGDAQRYVGSVRVDAQGIFADSRVLFKPDCDMTRYLGQVRRPERDLLRGLPAGEDPLVMAYEWEEAPGAEGFSAAMSKALLSVGSLKEKLGAEKLEAVVQQSIDLNHKVPGTSAVVDFGSEGKGLLYWGVYLTPESAAVQRQMRSLCQLTPEIMSAWGAFPAAMVPGTPEEIGGVAADVYQFNLDAESSPREPMMAALYGQNPTLYMAAHPDGLAYSFGPREDARRKLAALLSRDAPPLSQDPRVRALFKTLSARPQLCVLADIPALAKSATAVAEQFGVPIPRLELSAANTPLAGFAFYLEAEAFHAELFVPAEPIKAIVKVVEGLENKRPEPY